MEFVYGWMKIFWSFNLAGYYTAIIYAIPFTVGCVLLYFGFKDLSIYDRLKLDRWIEFTD